MAATAHKVQVLPTTDFIPMTFLPGRECKSQQLDPLQLNPFAVHGNDTAPPGQTRGGQDGLRFLFSAC